MLIKYGSIKNIITSFLSNKVFYYNFDPEYLKKWNIDFKLNEE